MLAESAHQDTVFGNNRSGSEAFNRIVDKSLKTLDDYLDKNKFVGFYPDEIEGKDGTGCFYYNNERTGTTVIALNLDYIEAEIVPYRECIVHEGVHAYNHAHTIDQDHDDDLLNLIESYGTENYYTTETAKLIVKNNDVAYLVSLFYADANMVHGDPYEDTPINATLEEWTANNLKWYDIHEYLEEPFGILRDEYSAVLVQSGLYEDIIEKSGS